MMTNSYICTKTTRDNKGAKGQSVSVRMCEQRRKEVWRVRAGGPTPTPGHTPRVHPHLIPHEHTQKHERRRRGAPLAVCVLGSSHEQSARMLRPAREPSPGRWSPPQRDQTPPLMLTAERLPAVSPSDP